MKKLFFILAAVMMTVSVMAAENIPYSFWGITLNKTLKEDVDNVLKGKGLQYLGEDSLFSHYAGELRYDGMKCQKVQVLYKNDTIHSIAFIDTCKETISNQCDYYTNLYKNRYKDLTQLSKGSSLLFQTGLPFESEVWGVTDYKTSLIISCDENKLITIYAYTSPGLKELIDSMNELATMFEKIVLNYDTANEVKGVMGVNFGETKANTLTAFKKRGLYLKDDGNISYFQDVSFGGSQFSMATLYFRHDPNKNTDIFLAVKFEKNFYTSYKEEALMMYDAICSKFNKKYTNGYTYKDEYDYKVMGFGMYEIDYGGGEVPPIIVTAEKGISKGGDKYFYVTVSYFGLRMENVDLDDL